MYGKLEPGLNIFKRIPYYFQFAFDDNYIEKWFKITFDQDTINLKRPPVGKEGKGDDIPWETAEKVISIYDELKNKTQS